MRCVIHLSDLHIRAEGSSEVEHLRTVVSTICARYSDAAPTTAVLITGDVTNDGLPSQFDLAKALLTPLYRAGFQVGVIPGNHDYGTMGIHAEKRRFEYFKQVFLGNEAVTYPHLQQFGDHILIGLNSMEDETHFFDGLFADGELGARQRAELGHLLNRFSDRPLRRKLILHLHHHPFYYADEGIVHMGCEWVGHRLKDGAALMDEIKGKVDVLLFGHEHRHLDFSFTRLSKEFNIPIILSAGKSTKVSKEYKVREDGTIDRNEIICEGLLGRIIDFDDFGGVAVKTLCF